jgi:hypothetical protein
MKRPDCCGIVVCVSLFFLNVLDGLMTAALFLEGRLIELNPIVSPMIDVMGIWFLIPKILIGTLASAVIAIGWSTYRIARVGGFIATGFYGMLIMRHAVHVLMWKGGVWP